MCVSVAALAALSACVSDGPEKPVVSAYSGSSVALQGFGMFGYEHPKPEFDAEAQRVCAKGKKSAEYASTRLVGEYRVEYLYLCG
ncbi:MAG: hypothetical protein EBR82_85120 [Caulobacteraceae bacterium]|nr:hypothetical protein [Caulobacteraceae bacterium]